MFLTLSSKTKFRTEAVKMAAIVCLLIFAVTGCQEEKKPAKRKPRAQPVVETAIVQWQSLNHTLSITGTLEPARMVHLYNQVPGLLIELPFYEGDQVKQGKTIAKLDDSIIKADYDKAQANLKQSRLDYSRLEKLAPSNLTSKELLTRAKTKVALNKAEYDLQKKRLSFTQIHAPWDGIVSERLVEPGDVLPLHSHFMTMIDTSSLIVKISVSELYLSQLNTQDTISFKIDALGSKVWSGHILRIYPSIDPNTRKGIVEVSLSPVPKGARPGQLTRVMLTTPHEKVLVIPLSAVRYDQQGAYVYALNDDKENENTIIRRTIMTGKKYPELIEVKEGLSADDIIVSKGLFGLSEGKKVTVLKSAQPVTTEAETTKAETTQPETAE